MTTPHDAPDLDDGQRVGDGDDGDDAQDRRAVLRGLASRPLDEHAQVYEGLHATLHAALAEIDDH
jgi:hypothetical protein